MSLDNTALRLESAPFRIREFIRKNAANIAERTIGERFRDLARGRGITKRGSQSFRAKVDGLQLELVWDYKGDDNQPLALWFEEGTKSHRVEPKEKKALSWIEGGQRFFSQGHVVSGIPAHHIMKDALQTGLPEFKEQLASQIEQHLEESKLG